jgi:hypothetical protein
MAKNQKKARVSIEKAAARQSKTASKSETAVTQSKETTHAVNPPDTHGNPDQPKNAKNSVKPQFHRPPAGPMTPVLAAKHSQIVANAMDLAAAEEQCLPTEKELLTSAEGVTTIPEPKKTSSVMIPSDQKSAETSETSESSQNQENTPVSTIDPQAAITISSQESVEPTLAESESLEQTEKSVEDSEILSPELSEKAQAVVDKGLKLVTDAIQNQVDKEDPALSRIKRYFGDGHYTYAVAAAQLAAICSNPSVMPLTTQWSEGYLDKLPKMLSEVLLNPGYLDSIWPQLKLVMGTSIGNVTWAAQIATSIAFFDLLKILSHPGMSQK